MSENDNDLLLQLEFHVVDHTGRVRIETFNTETDETEVLGEVASSALITRFIQQNYGDRQVVVWNSELIDWVKFEPMTKKLTGAMAADLLEQTNLLVEHAQRIFDLATMAGRVDGDVITRITEQFNRLSDAIQEVALQA